MNRKSPKRDHIRMFLYRELAEAPVSAVEIKERAIKEGLIWTSTEQEARRIGVIRHQDRSGWIWSLPSPEQTKVLAHSQWPEVTRFSEREVEESKEEVRHGFIEEVLDFFDGASHCDAGQLPYLESIRDRLINRLEGGPIAPIAAGVTEPSEWYVTDHVCKFCYGRLLIRRNESGHRHVFCPNCEANVTGNPKSLCMCGRVTWNGKDAGFRCVRNMNKTQEAQQVIIAIQVNPVEQAHGRLIDTTSVGVVNNTSQPVTWKITDHVCRICHGRLLSRHDKTGHQYVFCPHCGASTSGNHKSLCACGAKTRASKDRGHRCVVNPNHFAGITQKINVLLP
jgi:hypothetical protein